jgi:hypothetical protein
MADRTIGSMPRAKMGLHNPEGFCPTNEQLKRYTTVRRRLLTHPVKGLENYRELLDKLTNAKGAIKVFREVAGLSPRVTPPI